MSYLNLYLSLNFHGLIKLKSIIGFRKRYTDKKNLLVVIKFLIRVESDRTALLVVLFIFYSFSKRASSLPIS